MTAEATYLNDDCDVAVTAPSGGYASGQVIQVPDGRAGVIASLRGLDEGDRGAAQVKGLATVVKTAGIVFLDGQEVFWDHSANALTYIANSDKDFFVGTVQGDAASDDTTASVNLNVRSAPIISLQSSEFNHVPVLTAGTPLSRMVGGTLLSAFSATAEAQKLDLLSVRSFPVAANWILEAIVNVVTNAGADVADLNIGVANATHASDADQIAESVFFHFDMGADLNLDAESDDGTTEVAATDTQVDWAVGTPLHLMIDGRNPDDIQMYVNGANVLPATVFKLTAAVGPLKALFHFEKSANAAVGTVELHKLQVRISDVDAQQ